MAQGLVATATVDELSEVYLRHWDKCPYCDPHGQCKTAEAILNLIAQFREVEIIHEVVA